MVFVWLWTVVAAAVPLPWQLGEGAWYVEDAALLEEREASLRVSSAYLFEALDPDGERAGLVVVGRGQATLWFPDGLQARVAANRLAVADEPVSTVAAVSRGDGWSAGIDRVVLLGSGHLLPPEAVALHGRRGVVSYRADGVEEVLVTDLPDLGVARRRALTALNERAEAWAREALAPTTPALLDRLDERPGVRWLAGLRVAPDTTRPWSDERWLTWSHDPSGVLVEQVSGQVRVGAAHDGLVLSAALLPVTDGSHRGAARRVALRGAGVTGAFKVETGGQAAQLAVVADLQLEAVGGDARLVVLDVPHTEQHAWYSSPPLANAWSLSSVEAADGTALEVVSVPLTPDQREGRGGWRTVAVQLPEALLEGHTTTLRVRWTDRYRYAHVLETSNQLLLLDVSTGLAPVLPEVRGHDGATAPVRLRAWVASELDRDGILAAGVVQGREAPGRGLEWVESLTDTAGAVIAAGRFQEALVEGTDRMPDLSLYVQVRASAHAMAADLAHVARLVDPVVPEWPAQLTVVGADTRYLEAGGFGVGGGGMLQVSPSLLGDELQLPPSTVQASALVLDRWLDTEPRGEALEVARLGGDVVAWWGLQAAGTDLTRRQWTTAVRARARAGGRALVRDDHAREHRLHVASQALPAAFGEGAVRQAFTEVLAGRYEASWAGLANALGDASGIDARDFVTLWLASGVRPALDVRWRHDPESQELVALIVSDAPHASLPVTLTAHGPGAQQSVQVSVRDGVGRARVPWTDEAPRRLQVDTGALPVRSVEIRAVE